MSTIKALGITKIKALGLNNTGGIDKSQQKSLSIIYKSCAKDDKFIYLYFDVYSKTLNNNKAQVYVDELDGYLNDTAVPKTEVTISQNSGVGIILKFDKNKNFTESFYDDGNIFQATITCDGLSAKTTTFKLIFKKNTKDKKAEVVQKEYATQADWDKAAKDLGVNDSDLLKAIAQQESENIAFLASGKPKILYERHHFYDFYKDKYGVAKANELSQTHENIIKNANGGYGSAAFFSEDGRFDNEGYYNHQFDRLEKAIKINEDMAIKSTSFGIFQVLGEYCTYSNKTPKQFLQEMSRSEKFQIQAFVSFIKGDAAKKGLPSALNSKDWRKVASIYNGASWETYNPNYAKNIEKYYNKKPWKKKLLD
jgi:hypothetical protein